SVLVPSVVSKAYSFWTATHGRSRRRRASSSPRRECSFSAASSSALAASQSSRVPTAWSGIGRLLSVVGRLGTTRAIEPGDRLAFQLWHPLLVAVESEGATEEEREDAGAEQLVIRDRPVGLPKLLAAVGWQHAPVEDEVDAGVVVAEVDPIDH